MLIGQTRVIRLRNNCFQAFYTTYTCFAGKPISMSTRVSIVPSQQNGGFGSMTWANEPPSEAERAKVRTERNLMRAIISGNQSEFDAVFAKNSQMVNVNFESSGKTTPLHAAMAFGRASMASTLLARHADIKAKNSLGFTPLISAIMNGQEECVKMALQAGADKTEKTTKGETAQQIAERKGFQNIIALLR